MAKEIKSRLTSEPCLELKCNDKVSDIKNVSANGRVIQVLTVGKFFFSKTYFFLNGTAFTSPFLMARPLKKELFLRLSFCRIIVWLPRELLRSVTVWLRTFTQYLTIQFINCFSSFSLRLLKFEFFVSRLNTIIINYMNNIIQYI